MLEDEDGLQVLDRRVAEAGHPREERVNLVGTEAGDDEVGEDGQAAKELDGLLPGADRVCLAWDRALAVALDSERVGPRFNQDEKEDESGAEAEG